MLSEDSITFTHFVERNSILYTRFSVKLGLIFDAPVAGLLVYLIDNTLAMCKYSLIYSFQEMIRPQLESRERLDRVSPRATLRPTMGTQRDPVYKIIPALSSTRQRGQVAESPRQRRGNGVCTWVAAQSNGPRCITLFSRRGNFCAPVSCRFWRLNVPQHLLFS